MRAVGFWVIQYQPAGTAIKTRTRAAVVEAESFMADKVIQGEETVVVVRLSSRATCSAMRPPSPGGTAAFREVQ